NSLKIARSKSIKKDGANQSYLCMESHTGTHIDAAYHAMEKGWRLGSRKMADFIGDAIVADVSGFGKLIGKNALLNKKIRRNDIVLLKSENSRMGYSSFRKNYSSLAMDGAEYLVSLHVKAVGIDYLSIERFHSDMSVHRKLLSSGILIYEGLMLKGVKPGRYGFIGFPLKYDGDASPVRAVLTKD
ncbi:MAG: cyclase family protein, partial [Methanothrix sp.]